MAQANQLTQEYKEFVGLLNANGVEFEPCYSQRETRVLDGVPISFISLADLRRNKASTGRLKDQLDLKNLAGLNS